MARIDVPNHRRPSRTPGDVPESSDVLVNSGDVPDHSGDVPDLRPGSLRPRLGSTSRTLGDVPNHSGDVPDRRPGPPATIHLVPPPPCLAAGGRP